MSEQHHDPLAIAPHVSSVLFENDRVRMLAIDIKPGDQSARHNHPEGMVYVVTGGTLRMTTPEGSMEVEIPAGVPVWQPALVELKR